MSQSEEPPQGPEQPEDVGYGKPPKKTQFKKGKSGNPKGRPKKEPFHVMMEEILSEGITLNMGNGGQMHVSKKEAILQLLINKCIKGDAKSLDQFLHILEKWHHLHPV